MQRTVTIEYSDGTKREIEPAGWQAREGMPPKPIFNPSPYIIVETMDGRYIAVTDQT